MGNRTKPLPGQVGGGFLLVGGILAMVSNESAGVDKFIAFGNMALEQGWYDQAREHFEQALALDASNREAIEGLEQVDKALEHKAFFESLEAPARPVSRGHSAIRWMRSVIGRIREAREAQARREKERAREWAEAAILRAEEVDKVKQAWAEKRVQRGNIPLQFGQCPECGSIDSYRSKEISDLGCLIIAITFPVGLLGYFFLPDLHHCRVCGAKWKG